MGAAESAKRPPFGVATFDSASAMVRALARSLHGEGFPALGQPRYAQRLAPLANALPRSLRDLLFAAGGPMEAAAPDKAPEIDASAIAGWMAGLYPKRRYPAAMIGSSNGALIHLCAACGIPWLPQTSLTLVRQSHPDPDDAQSAMAAGRDLARALLEANPGVTVHHMHDPNQDRRMLRYVSYFRLKHRSLPDAYRRFLVGSLQRGGTIYIVKGARPWPLTRITDRYCFQFGARGGASKQQYFESDDSVAQYLTRVGASRRCWNPPAPSEKGPEAEWGYEPALDGDLEALAAERGLRIVRLAFADPEEASPLVADLFRYWYARHGIEESRLLIPSFIQLDPYWTIRTRSVPFWMIFNIESSQPRIRRYLSESGPFDEIRMMLFSNATNALGQASIEGWRSILREARREGSFLGVDEKAYPHDFASMARYQPALKALRPHGGVLPPLELTAFESHLRDSGEAYGVQMDADRLPPQAQR